MQNLTGPSEGYVSKNWVTNHHAARRRVRFAFGIPARWASDLDAQATTPASKNIAPPALARASPIELFFERAFDTGGGGTTITAPPAPRRSPPRTTYWTRLGSLGPTGDPLVCAALLRAVSSVEGLALREVAAVDTHGSHVKVGQRSAALLVQAAVDCTTTTTTTVAGGTVRLARRVDSDLRPVGDLLVAGQLTRRHAAAVLHGVRGLDANIVADSLDAICAVALLTDPDTRRPGVTGLCSCFATCSPSGYALACRIDGDE